MRSAKLLALASLALLLVLSTKPAQAQKSRKQLEKERTENLRKIKEASSILKQTQKERRVSLGQLRALNAQINGIANLINTLKQEISLLNTEMAELDGIVQALEGDLQALKKEYGAMLYAASKYRRQEDQLFFVFSSKGFSQLLGRLKYLEQYVEARKKQAELIMLVTEELVMQREQVEAKKLEKDRLLGTQVTEGEKLKTLRSSKTKLVKQLTAREKDLKAEVASRNASVARLDEAIATAIKEEIQKTEGLASTPAGELLSANFAENRKHMPWPVGAGFISEKFGEHPHPVHRGVKTKNSGVDIQTNKGEKVKAVFDGTVKHVLSVPGMNQAVLISHGDYFTLYARLGNVDVEVGQEVKAKDIIGEVYTNSDGVSEVQFQVWRLTKKLNPEEWLSKR